MAATRVILIRHAESEGNATAICECAGDSALTKRGERQARVLARRLRASIPGASRVYSSPLGRAQQTAMIIARNLGSVVSTVTDLREVEVGAMEGLPLAEVDLTPLMRDVDFAFEGGESTRSFATRSAGAIRRLVEAHSGETVVAVSHGVALAGALSLLLDGAPAWGRQYVLRNAGLAELWFDPVPRLGEIELRQTPSQ